MVTSQYQLSPGKAKLPGTIRIDNGVNFTLQSRVATQVVLCLHDIRTHQISAKIPLSPAINKTGDFWHIHVENLPKNQIYSYLISSEESKEPKSISDPYCQELTTHQKWGDLNKKKYFPLSTVNEPDEFDWEGVTPPNLEFKDLIIYEMHVRGFTKSPSSSVSSPGSYLGLIEKIPYLKNLGINAVELLPVYEFNECENNRKNPETDADLYNFWGYSTVSFFAPMGRFSSEAGKAKYEFKQMVKAFHKEGIEVILDVVYNHTAEGDENGPCYSFKGIDPSSYYLFTDKKEYYNYSGCGNTVNSNNPITRNFILDSLKYWVTEMHVDGFRFDLASILTRGQDQGIPLNNPPVVEAIAFDPILRHVKLIAEAWDAGGLYQVGTFPAYQVWGEWNGKFRDTIRSFIKGSGASPGEFATRISGSEDMYASSGRSPYHSINFITAHDGFSLYDLVSYNNKHNLANGEESKDGANDNCSWNCGVEGITDNKEIISLRSRQVRNYLLALFISQGTPMILSGDEYGHSKEGNNNTYCLDDEKNWFQWNDGKQDQGLLLFTKKLIKFRKLSPLLGKRKFLQDTDISWHGLKPKEPNWGSFFIAGQLHGHDDICDHFFAFNAQDLHVTPKIPKPPKGHHWVLLANTANKSPEDFFLDKDAPKLPSNEFPLLPYSSILLCARKTKE